MPGIAGVGSGGPPEIPRKDAHQRQQVNSVDLRKLPNPKRVSMHCEGDVLHAAPGVRVGRFGIAIDCFSILVFYLAVVDRIDALVPSHAVGHGSVSLRARCSRVRVRVRVRVRLFQGVKSGIKVRVTKKENKTEEAEDQG